MAIDLLKHRMSRALCLLSLITITACSRWPDSYPPPRQMAFIPDGPLTLVTVVNMNDPGLENFVVHDVPLGNVGTVWRWSADRPEFRFPLDRSKRYKAVLDFAIADSTFRDTGPVTISFSINGHPAGKVRYEQSGGYKFEKDVPAQWMKESDRTTLAAKVDPVWISPTDGARLGIILRRAGFLPL